MRTVTATEFKSRCLALLEEVQRTRGSLVVTRHGKPVASIVPYAAPQASRKNPLRGSILYEGDLISPIPVRWDAAD